LDNQYLNTAEKRQNTTNYHYRRLHGHEQALSKKRLLNGSEATITSRDINQGVTTAAIDAKPQKEISTPAKTLIAKI
jgi:hypothetical protein